MATKRRSFRVAEKLQEIIASKLLTMSDPRLYLITITGAVISPDLRHAKVYWMVSGDSERRELAEEGLEASSGLIRSRIAKELGTRIVPEIKFHYDDTLDTQARLEELLTKARVGGEE